MRGPAILCLVALCLLPSQGLAATGTAPADAHFAPFGPGNGLIAWAADPAAGALYAGFEYGGLSRSSDGGRSWTWSGQGLGGKRGFQRAIQVVAVGLAGEVYAATKAGRRIDVMGSFDRGASWSPMGSLPCPDNMVLRQGALAPGGEPGVLYFAVSGELWKSADQGRSWSPVLQTKSGISAVVAGPGGTREVYVATLRCAGQVLRSTDGGATWTELQHGLPALPVTGLAIAPGTAGRPATIYAGISRNGLYASTDGGAAWRQLDSSYGNLELKGLDVDAADPATVYAAYRWSPDEPFQVRISRDGGVTWHAGGLLMGESPPIGGVDFIVLGSTLYAAAEIDLAASSDRGMTWSYRLRGGVGYTPEGSRVRFAPGDSATVYTLTGQRAFKSVDGGHSWVSFATPLLHSGKSALRDLALDPAHPETLYAVGDLGVFRSSDGGELWRLTGPAAGHLAVLPGGTVLAGGCGLVRSADAGATWSEVLSCQAENGARRKVEKLLPDPAAPDTIFAAVEETADPEPPVRQIYRSRDAGRTWSPILAGAGVLALSPRPPAVLYAIQGDLLLVSRDGGDTFQESGRIGLPIPPRGEPVADLLVDGKAPATLYASTRGHGLRRSTDGGATWVELEARVAAYPENEATGYLSDLTADPARPDVLYAAVLAGTGLLRVEL